MKRALIIKKNNYKNLTNNFNIKFDCEKEYDLLILTTAINRPNLHNISFNNYSNFITKDIKIKWIINIDFVKFSEDLKAEDELEFTKNNILEIFKEHQNIDFEFILNEKGNFNKAVRNLTKYASNDMAKNLKFVLYLEDDWVAKNEFKLNNLINSKFDFIKLYIDRDPRKKLSFQPSLMRPYIWYLMFYQRLKNNLDTNKDPEKICQIDYITIESYNLSFDKFDFFKDIGRDFQINDDNTIRGWYQIKSENNENISLTYIYIDKLIKSILYLKSINKINHKNIRKHFIDYLKLYFNTDVLSKIIKKFDTDEKNMMDFYNQCLNLNNKKKYSLKYIYHHIDIVSETGA